MKQGKDVLALDQLLRKEYFYQRIPKKYHSNLSFQQATFEQAVLPQVDCIVALFSLPFCHPESFSQVWNRLVDSLGSGGLLLANLFGNHDYRKDREDINTFSKEEILELLKDFEIKKWKEQEYDRSIDNTHWHYFDFVAVKKSTN